MIFWDEISAHEAQPEWSFERRTPDGVLYAISPRLVAHVDEDGDLSIQLQEDQMATVRIYVPMEVVMALVHDFENHLTVASVMET